jgi:hypothetical protein
MDDTEAHVKRYLEHLDIGPVVFEPDGNVTPDFLVGGRIAVEVRRLNQHHMPDELGSKPEGLEQADIPLQRRVRKLLASYGPPTANSASVAYRFERPVDEWRTLEPKIRAELDRFRNSDPKQLVQVQIGKFFLTIRPLSIPLSAEFRPHFISDEDSGGWIVDLMCQNLEIVIPEKEAKINRRRTAYPEWWLVLVDHIGINMDQLDKDLLREQLNIQHTLDKVIVLSATDPTNAFIL